MGIYERMISNGKIEEGTRACTFLFPLQPWTAYVVCMAKSMSAIDKDKGIFDNEGMLERILLERRKYYDR